MKKLLTTTVLTGIACFGLALPLEAQTKLGILNLQKVFDGYWKTRQADAQLNEQANEYKKTEKEFTDDYQKQNEEYRKLLEGASDAAISADEREKRKKLAEEKLRKIQTIEEQLRTFTQTARTTLGERYRRMREGVLNEIQEIVTAKARAAGYSVVVDTAAQSANQTLVIMYNNGENDLTQVVLAELNKNAPAEFLKPAEIKPLTTDPRLTQPNAKPAGRK